jgi:hypothetical protein
MPMMLVTWTPMLGKALPVPSRRGSRNKPRVRHCRQFAYEEWPGILGFLGLPNRCGLAFETAARTNTRCRRCRHVVNVGRSSRPTTAEPVREVDDGADELAGPESSPIVLGVGLAAAGAVCLWHGWRLGGDEAADPQRVRRARVRWCLAGAALAGAGVWVVVVAVRE